MTKNINSTSGQEGVKGSRRFGVNVLFLTLAQWSEYLVALILMPFLLRKLGPDVYGGVAFSQAFCIYFMLLVEYGFAWSGVRKISPLKLPCDKLVISSVFWSIQWAKLILMLFSLALIAVLIFLFPKLYEFRLYISLGTFSIIGMAFYPQWLLQGIDKIREAAAFMLISRVCTLLMIFWLVGDKNDAYLAILLQSSVSCIAAIISWFYICSNRYLIFMPPNKELIKGAMKDGWAAFFATTSTAVYRTSSAVVLGLVASTSAVAYYVVAEKLIRVIQELARPLVQATYPRVAQLLGAQPKLAYKLLRHVLIFFFLTGVVISFAILIFSQEIVNLIAGNGFDGAAHVLRLMAFIPFFGGINSVLGVLLMHNIGQSQVFSRYVGLAGLLNLTLVFPLVNYWADSGAAYGYFLSELFLFLLLCRFHYSNKTPIFNKNV